MCDALEFGQHVKLGGWRLGLLVARNVEKAKAGVRRGSDFNWNQNGKVNAKQFAEKAGVGHAKVLRYLEAWNKAAADIEELPTQNRVLERIDNRPLSLRYGLHAGQRSNAGRVGPLPPYFPP